MQSLIFVVSIALIQISLCQATDTFEFGSNEGRVAFTTSGTIGIFEKNVRIPIVVPECEIVTYVRVDVNNILGPPKVHIDTDMTTVVFKYRFLQYSLSSYTVTAKTITDPDC